MSENALEARQSWQGMIAQWRAYNILYWGKKTSPFHIYYYTQRATMHTSSKKLQKHIQDFLYSILKLSSIIVNILSSRVSEQTF